jgi:hypothetical protein
MIGGAPYALNVRNCSAGVRIGESFVGSKQEKLIFRKSVSVVNYWELVKLATHHLIQFTTVLTFDDSGTSRDNIMRQNEASNLAHKQQILKSL